MRLVLSALRLRRVQVWLILLAALASLLAFVPLFNLLGYEFSLALALAGSLAGAHLGSVLIGWLRGRRDALSLGVETPGVALAALLGRSVGLALLLLAPPLALISANALRVKNCDYLEGLAFFAMMPVLSTGIAACAGSLWALAVPRRALASALAVLTVLGSLAWGVYRFYAAPPIFGYDAFAGYFPGTLYDEEISLHAPFFVYRAQNLLWLAGASLLAARLLDPASLRLRLRALGRPAHRALLPVAGLCLAAGLALFLLGGKLGYAPDARSIQGALGGVRRTAHFDLYYPSELEPRAVDLLADDHEFRYAQLAALLGAAPTRISSYVFRSPEEKRALMGAAQVFIAKPWRREVYLQQARFPHPVLKHELAHIFAGEFGDPLLHISLRWRWTPLPHPIFNVGLIEGLAVAADWRPSGEVDGHQQAAILRRIGLAPPIASLFGAGFLAQPAGQAYTLAGSFCRFLLERHGAAPLREAYRSAGDFGRAYGRPLPALLTEWTTFLDGLTLPEAQLQLAREHFRTPSILRRVCGHEVASLLAEVGELAARGRHEEAARVLERIIVYDPSEPRRLLELMGALAAARGPAAALAVVPRALAHPALSKPLQRRVLEQAGDLRWLSGDEDGARRDYAAAAELAAGPSERRLLALKRWALGPAQPAAVRQVVRDYTVAPPGRKRDSGLEIHLAHRLAALLPDSGLGSYLVGKQLAGREERAEAIQPLEQALEGELPGPDFEIEARLVLGECLYVTGALDRAVAEFAKLSTSKNLSHAVRLDLTGWFERIHWRRAGSVPLPDPKRTRTKGIH